MFTTRCSIDPQTVQIIEKRILASALLYPQLRHCGCRCQGRSGWLVVDEKKRGPRELQLGANEGGKTNEALQVVFNMMKTVENSKGIYIKAEGRLSNSIKQRSGLKFVTDADEWVTGTCLVFECNVFDVVFDFLRGLLKNNPNRERFGIVIDSMDGLLPQSELEKRTSDAAKVAAGALMTSDFLKRVSLGMSKFGHLLILISQIRAKVDINPYAKGDPNNQTNSSGGNAALHYPDWILEFQKQFKSDKIKVIQYGNTRKSS